MTPEALENMNHVQEKAMERYGVYLSESLIFTITKLIREGDIPLYKRISDNVEFYMVEVQNTKLYLLYSQKIRHLKTVYTKPMVEGLAKKAHRQPRGTVQDPDT